MIKSLLGIDGEDVPEEKRERVLALFHEIRGRMLQSNDEMLKLVKISLMNDDELVQYRQFIAENGVEYTPEELKSIVRVIKIVLKSL
jgi:hypothetical protein